MEVTETFKITIDAPDLEDDLTNINLYIVDIENDSPILVGGPASQYLTVDFPAVKPSGVWPQHKSCLFYLRENDILKDHKGPIISESGIKTKEELLKINLKTKIKTFLIGESLLRNIDKNSIFSVL